VLCSWVIFVIFLPVKRLNTVIGIGKTVFCNVLCHFWVFLYLEAFLGERCETTGVPVYIPLQNKIF
jgi:hypothetical protein